MSAGQRVVDLVAQGAGEGGASETRGSARALPGALVLGGGLLGAAAGAGLAWILGASLAAVGGVTAGFMLMAAVLWALSRRHPSRSRHPLDGLLAEARHALATAEAVLRDEARALGDGPRALPDLRTIEAAEAALERERPRAEEQRRAEEQLATARAALARVSERREGALTRLEDAQAALGAAEQGWRDWLQHAGLPLHLAPSTADALLGRIEVTRSHLQGVRELRRRVGDIAAEIARYRARVEPLARRAGAEVSFADEDTVTVADALIRRYDAAREARRHREQALALVDERERTWASARSRMSDAQDALAALLAAGGVKDPETFRRRARVAEQREAAEQERRECERRLRQLVGDDDDALKALDDALASTTREEIAARRDSAQTAIEELRARRDELITRRGSIAAELARLQGDEHASEVRARAAALRSQLDDAAQRWSALALARTFLQRTRERYERDRQPAVIRRAEAHFEALTGGRYVRLYQPVGEPVVRVEERDGGVKTPGQLSRGSREQLYLALRLGAIEEAVERNEPLPVIVDDVMVNFDRTRARRAAEAFVRLAAHTQVVVFTCHAWVAELFAEATSDVAVIDLDHVDFETGPTGTIALPAGDGDESRARRAPNEGGASTGDGDAQITQRLL